MRVLIVEHDGATRAILLSTLRARRHQVEALRESESRFEAFMTNSPTAAFIKDARGRFLYVNRRCLELFLIEESDRIVREMTQLLGRVISGQAQLSLQLTDDMPATLPTQRRSGRSS
jgi:PAS domain-containing protein